MRKENLKSVRSVKIKVAVFSVLIIALLMTWYILEMQHARKIHGANKMTHTITNKLELILSSLQKIPSDIAFALGNTKYNSEDIDTLLRSIVRSNDEIMGSAISYEPFMFDSTKYYYSPYYFEDKNKLHFLDLGDPSYDYFIWDWYLLPKILGKPVWSDPYFDKGGSNKVISTFSVPIYFYPQKDTVFIGVITTDISLNWLDEINDKITKYFDGFVLLISSNGKIISAPQIHEDWELNHSIFSLAKTYQSKELEELGYKMKHTKQAVMEFDTPFNKCSFFKYRKISNNDWVILVCLP